MTELEQKILDATVAQLWACDGDYEATTRLLKGIAPQLPAGEAKKFFEEIDRLLVIPDEVIKNNLPGRIEEALAYLKMAREKFIRTSVVTEIPRKILMVHLIAIAARIAALNVVKELRDAPK